MMDEVKEWIKRPIPRPSPSQPVTRPPPGGRSGRLGPGKMLLHYLKRQGTHPTKITIHVDVQSLTFPTKHGLDLQPVGTFFSVLYAHKSHIMYTTGRKAEVSPTGGVFVRVEEALSQNITLYRETSGVYQEKVDKLILRRRIKPGNFDECFEKIGYAVLNLHELARDAHSHAKSCSLPIEQCNCQGGEMQVMITMTFLESQDRDASFSGEESPQRDSRENSFTSIDSPHSENLFRNRSREREKQRLSLQESSPLPSSSSSSSSSSSLMSPKNEYFDPFSSVLPNETSRLGQSSSLRASTKEYKSGDIAAFDADLGPPKGWETGNDTDFSDPFPPRQTQGETRGVLGMNAYKHHSRNAHQQLSVEANGVSSRRLNEVTPAAPKSMQKVENPPPLPPREPRMHQQQQQRTRLSEAVGNVSIIDRSELGGTAAWPRKVTWEEGSSGKVPAQTSSSSTSTTSSFSGAPAPPLGAGLHGALNKLTHTDNASRHFPDEDMVSEELQKFIEEPSFAKLIERGDTSVRVGTSETSPPPIPERDDMGANKKEVVSERKEAKGEAKKGGETKREARSAKRLGPPKSTSKLKMEEVKSSSDGIVRAEAKGADNEESITVKQRPKSQTQDDDSPTPPSSTHSLSPEYESQAQQAAYQALQSQIESGVVYSSEEQQKTVYFAYYNYYSQYYMQMQLREEEGELRAQEDMAKELEKQEALEKEQREKRERDKVRMLETQVEELRTAMQRETKEITKQTEVSRAENESLRQQVSEWKERCAMNTAQHERESSALRQELKVLKEEFVLMEQGTNGLQRTIEFYKAKASDMEDRYAVLSSEMETLQVRSRQLDSGVMSDNDSCLVQTSQSTLEAEKKKVLELRVKVKRYAERMASMEVLVAEAAIIKAAAAAAAEAEAAETVSPAAKELQPQNGEEEAVLMGADMVIGAEENERRRI